MLSHGRIVRRGGTAVAALTVLAAITAALAPASSATAGAGAGAGASRHYTAAQRHDRFCSANRRARVCRGWRPAARPVTMPAPRLSNPPAPTAAAAPGSYIGRARVPAGLYTGHGPAAGSAARPNIVMVLSDDEDMSLLPYMPNVVKMMHNGMTFNSHYVVDSLCCPSRTAIFTGEYPHDNGVFTNGGDDGGFDGFNNNDDAAKSFQVALQNNGYTTDMIGKYLNDYQTSDPAQPGWSEWNVSGGGAYSEYGYSIHETHPGIDRVVSFGHTVGATADDGDYATDVFSRLGQDFIDRQHGSPFLLEIAPFSPHANYLPPARHAGVTVPDPAVGLPNYNTHPANAPGWIASNPALSDDVAGPGGSIQTHYDMRVGSVQAIDDMIGALSARLRAMHELRNTYFVFTSDNGYHMGEYGLDEGKQTIYDTDIHVPLVIAGPGIAAGSSTEQMTSNIDFAPTFEEWTATPQPVDPVTGDSDVDGTSLTPLVNDPAGPADWQQAVLVEHHNGNGQTGYFDPDQQNVFTGDPPNYDAIRTPHGVYAEYNSGHGVNADGSYTDPITEFYDTDTDPYEMDDIASTDASSGETAMMLRMADQLHRLTQCHTSSTCQAAAR